MVGFARAVLVVVAIGAMACRPPVTFDATFKSQVASNDPPATSRWLVVVNRNPGFFSDDMFDGFQEGLAARLAICGVQVSTIERDPMALDSEQRAVATLEQVHADAVMLLDQVGARFVPSSSTLSFDLIVQGVRSREVMWRADSELKLGSAANWSERSGMGAGFATNVASQLYYDGMLPGCPKYMAGWPDLPQPVACARIRRRILREAAQIERPELRAAKLQRAPTCGNEPGGS